MVAGRYRHVGPAQGVYSFSEPAPGWRRQRGVQHMHADAALRLDLHAYTCKMKRDNETSLLLRHAASSDACHLAEIRCCTARDAPHHYPVHAADRTYGTTAGAGNGSFGGARDGPDDPVADFESHAPSGTHFSSRGGRSTGVAVGSHRSGAGSEATSSAAVGGGSERARRTAGADRCAALQSYRVRFRRSLDALTVRHCASLDTVCSEMIAIRRRLSDG